MKYILEEEEAPMFYSSYGKFVHKLIEEYNVGLIEKEVMPSKFLIRFSKEVVGERPSDTTVAKYLQKGFEYFSEFNPMPFNVIGTEEEVRFKIGEYNFVGFIDCIGEIDGELVVLDHKSRDLKPRSKRKKPTLGDIELDEMLVQLYLYAEAVYQIYGKYPVLLQFNCFKEMALISEKFNREKCEEAKQWAIETIKDIREVDEFLPSVEYFKCKNICGLHKECCYWEEGTG